MPAGVSLKRLCSQRGAQDPGGSIESQVFLVISGYNGGPFAICILSSLACLVHNGLISALGAIVLACNEGARKLSIP